MPYKTKTKTVTKTGTKTVEKDMGFQRIKLMRPRFVFFEFTGLRPNTKHWIFFGERNVNAFINTTVTLDGFNNANRSSDFRNPGDKFTSSSTFPTSLGGASSNIKTDDTGKLEGCFYLQNNATWRWPCGTVGLTAIDISKLKKSDALSVGSAAYTASGVKELYAQYEEQYQYTVTESYQEYYSKPSSNDDNNGSTAINYTKPASSGIDLPGNVLSRALGIGNGGKYSAAIKAGASQKDAIAAGGGGNDGWGSWF